MVIFHSYVSHYQKVTFFLSESQDSGAIRAELIAKMLIMARLSKIQMNKAHERLYGGKANLCLAVSRSPLHIHPHGLEVRPKRWPEYLGYLGRTDMLCYEVLCWDTNI